MKDATASFFEAIGQRGHEPLLERATGTARFDIQDGKRTERWLVTVKKGDIAVSRRNAAADTVVRASRATFNRLASGKANPLAEILRGTVSMEGDPELLVLMQRLFPGSGSAAARQTAGYARRQK